MKGLPREHGDVRWGQDRRSRSEELLEDLIELTVGPYAASQLRFPDFRSS